MRPPGDVRCALRRGFSELARTTGPVDWVAVLPLLEPMGINARSRADCRLVRNTVQNMVRSGELVCAAKHKAEGRRVWRSLYEPAAALVDVADVPARMMAPSVGADVERAVRE